MSVGSAATKLMNADEFFDWCNRPENDNKWFELVRGEVIELPAPSRPRGVACVNLARILGNYVFRKGKGYLASNDSGVILERDPDTVRGPDLAYYEDANTFADLHPKYGEVPPRLAVEVLSPSDRADRVMRKVTDYLRNGVEVVWVIDPEARTVTVYSPDNGPRVFVEEGQLTGNDVVPGFRCRVAETFLLPGDQLPEKATSPRKRGKK